MLRCGLLRVGVLLAAVSAGKKLTQCGVKADLAPAVMINVDVRPSMYAYWNSLRELLVDIARDVGETWVRGMGRGVRFFDDRISTLETESLILAETFLDSSEAGLQAVIGEGDDLFSTFGVTQRMKSVHPDWENAPEAVLGGEKVGTAGLGVVTDMILNYDFYNHTLGRIPFPLITVLLVDSAPRVKKLGGFARSTDWTDLMKRSGGYVELAEGRRRVARSEMKEVIFVLVYVGLTQDEKSPVQAWQQALNELGLNGHFLVEPITDIRAGAMRAQIEDGIVQVACTLVKGEELPEIDTGTTELVDAAENVYGLQLDVEQNAQQRRRMQADPEDQADQADQADSAEPDNPGDQAYAGGGYIGPVLAASSDIVTREPLVSGLTLMTLMTLIAALRWLARSGTPQAQVYLEDKHLPPLQFVDETIVYVADEPR